MRRAMTLSGLSSLAALGAAMITFLPADGLPTCPAADTSSYPSRDRRRAVEMSYRRFMPRLIRRCAHRCFLPMSVSMPRPIWRAAW